MRKRHILPVLLVVLVAAPLALAGGAQKAWLTRPEGVEGDFQGFLKVKADRAGNLQLFEVNVQKAAPSTTYEIWLDDDYVGDLLTDEAGAGKFKVNTRRGDDLGVEDPAGTTAKVVLPGDPDDTVILSAVVPDPTAPKTPSAAAKAALDPAVDGKGFVKIKAGNGANLFQVVVQQVEPGTYDVLVGGEDIGDLTVPEGEDCACFLINDRRGDPLPAGCGTILDLVGAEVVVQTQAEEPEEPVVVFTGTVPDPVEKKGKRRGQGPK